MSKTWRSYGFGLVFLVLFVLAWAGMTWSGWINFVAEQHQHHQSAEWFGLSGYIWQWGVQTFSNWNSDFLGLGITIILGAYLIYKGSQESRDSDEELEQMVQRIERRLDPQAATAQSQTAAQEQQRGWWRNHSLAIVFLVLFFLAWAAQTWMGWMNFVDQQHQHAEGAELFGPSGYVINWLVTTLENWQSDFLGQAAEIILAAYLIYRGSSQSKDGDERIEQTVRRIERRVEELDKAGQLRRSPPSPVRVRS